MHLCFIDESGSPPKPGKIGPRPYFIIAGLIMHEAQWHSIADEVRKLKARFKVSGEIKWRYFGPDNTDPDNSVAHLSASERDRFRELIYEILTKRKSVKIIACIAKCETAYKAGYVKDEEDLYLYTYKPVSERFQYFLQDVSHVVGDKQYGIIIADHRGKKQDDSFRLHHKALVENEGTFVSTYENYVETIFLTPSHHSVGIQLADMVAGAIGRAMNTGESRFARLIKPALRTGPKDRIMGYGLVRFPKRSK